MGRFRGYMADYKAGAGRPEIAKYLKTLRTEKNGAGKGGKKEKDFFYAGARSYRGARKGRDVVDVGRVLHQQIFL